jgi:hypothetical protein
MSNVSSIGDVYHWSIAKIAEAFGLDRKSVRRKLLEANMPVAGTVKGNSVYALRDVGPVLFGSLCPGDVEVAQDPTRMEPKERKDWFQSENERIKLQKSLRQLIPDSEVMGVFSAMSGAMVQVLDTLPDILERDCALSPQAVLAVQSIIDNLRNELASRTYAACAAALNHSEPGTEGQDDI